LHEDVVTDGEFDMTLRRFDKLNMIHTLGLSTAPYLMSCGQICANLRD
jgi:hypothetical protein